MKLMQTDQIGSLLAVLKVSTSIHLEKKADSGRCVFRVLVKWETLEDKEEGAEKHEHGGNM